MKNKFFIIAFGLLLTFGIAFADNNLISAKSSKKVLVAYYSWGGNTKSIAEKIHKKVGGDIFEIVPKTPYPTDYRKTCDVAKAQKEKGIVTPLKSNIDVSKYDVIFVGTPAWWYTMATPVKSFLISNKKGFEGKIIVPFVTHGGGGKYNIPAEMKDISKAKVLKKEFVVYENGDSSTDKNIDKWIKELGL